MDGIKRISDFPAGSDIPRLKDCPDCDGRGWFLINPFATGGLGGAGGPGNMRVCNMCVRAKEHFDALGKLPDDVVEKIRKKQALASLEAQRAWWKPNRKKK